MVHYRRNFVPGGTHFFTVTLADRRAALLTDRIDALGAAFRQCRSSHPFETLAIAVMPEHLHCVWTLPNGDADYAIRWSLIKRAFTRRQYHEGPTPARAKRGVWQARFWEHAIRGEVDLHRHIDYVHFNPVKHGHVRRAADWPHSSFHRYVRHRFVAEDWASDAEDDPAEFGEMGTLNDSVSGRDWPPSNRAIARPLACAPESGGVARIISGPPRLTCVNTNGQLRATLEVGAAIRRRGRRHIGESA